MVKGISKKVVVVHAPDPLFEEAIFVLREDAKTGFTAEDVLRQAQTAAREYLSPPRRRPWLPLVLGAAGAAAAGGLWLLACLL